MESIWIRGMTRIIHFLPEDGNANFSMNQNKSSFTHLLLLVPRLFHIFALPGSTSTLYCCAPPSLPVSMAKVRAAYNYSYNYEGKKISFKKDEEFQLLTKSNKDWWQVRRWLDGSAQDIYVPAVYVKEVEGAVVVVKEEKDPTYMNLDDLKIPKPVENGRKSSGSGEKLPPVLSKPKPVSSLKKNSLDQNRPPSEKKSSVEADSSESSNDVKTNGLNLTRPISPTILRRLSNKGVNPVNTESQGTSSLKRGENLVLPPPVSTKPRSKSSAVDTESSLDSGSRLARQTSGGGVQGAKGKVPPPVQSKPRPQKVPICRPMSCMTPTTDTEGVESKPIMSELSNVLLKKNPHLAGEHRPLMKSSSSGAVVDSVMRGEGQSVVDAKSPTEEKVRGLMGGWGLGVGERGRMVFGCCQVPNGGKGEGGVLCGWVG